MLNENNPEFNRKNSGLFFDPMVSIQFHNETGTIKIPRFVNFVYWVASPSWCNPGATAIDFMYRVDKIDAFTPHIWALWTCFDLMDIIDKDAFDSKSGTLSIELRGLVPIIPLMGCLSRQMPIYWGRFQSF